MPLPARFHPALPEPPVDEIRVVRRIAFVSLALLFVPLLAITAFRHKPEIILAALERNPNPEVLKGLPLNVGDPTLASAVFKGIAVVMIALPVVGAYLLVLSFTLISKTLMGSVAALWLASAIVGLLPASGWMKGLFWVDWAVCCGWLGLAASCWKAWGTRGLSGKVNWKAGGKAGKRAVTKQE